MEGRDRTGGVLAAVAIGFCLAAIVLRLPQIAGLAGITYPDGRVFGADFLNLWSAARLVLSGHVTDIYRPEILQAYEEALAGTRIGLRLWVYPPHSLFLVVPFGLVGYYLSYAAWTLFGMAALWFGARRFGFTRAESGLLLISPAAQLCVDNGQTGNLAAGLLLLALAPVRAPTGLAPVAAAILTIKPQLGFLLPVFWALQRRWRDIVVTSVLTLALAGLSVLCFGIGSWADYAGQTLPVLGALESGGSGPFMWMIPSVFMSVRIVTDNSELALAVHLLWAVLVGCLVLWRMIGSHDGLRRAGLVMVGTVLITPYIHNYDLTLLAAAALLALRRRNDVCVDPRVTAVACLTAYAVPILVIGLNAIGLPLSPLLMLGLVFLV